MRSSSFTATPGTDDQAHRSAPLNLNSDIGEGAGEDEAILACIDSANVACGVHAGSASITIATARRCVELGVELGAHPGYDDRGGFADRLMLPDGSLAPRDQAGAVLNPKVAAEQAVALARSGRYDTVCVHGDTKGAGQIATIVRAALREAGIETGPLAPR